MSGGQPNVGPWANGAHFAGPPGIHSGPLGSQDYINRLLAYGQAPTIPDTFTPMQGGHKGPGEKKIPWFKIALGAAAAFFGFSLLRGTGQAKALKELGQKALSQLGKLFQKKPVP